jgi:hypothetical protein
MARGWIPTDLCSLALKLRYVGRKRLDQQRHCLSFRRLIRRRRTAIIDESAPE